jgi:hypothetical protein
VDASSDYGLACVASDSIAASSEGGAVRMMGTKKKLGVRNSDAVTEPTG